MTLTTTSTSKDGSNDSDGWLSVGRRAYRGAKLAAPRLSLYARPHHRTHVLAYNPDNPVIHETHPAGTRKPVVSDGLYRCPRWDSNPHCADFEAASSTNWDTGAPVHCSAHEKIYYHTMQTCPYDYRSSRNSNTSPRVQRHDTDMPQGFMASSAPLQSGRI